MRSHSSEDFWYETSKTPPPILRIPIKESIVANTPCSSPSCPSATSFSTTQSTLYTASNHVASSVPPHIALLDAYSQTDERVTGMGSLLNSHHHIISLPSLKDTHPKKFMVNIESMTDEEGGRVGNEVVDSLDSLLSDLNNCIQDLELMEEENTIVFSSSSSCPITPRPSRNLSITTLVNVKGTITNESVVNSVTTTTTSVSTAISIPKLWTPINDDGDDLHSADRTLCRNPSSYSTSSPMSPITYLTPQIRSSSFRHRMTRPLSEIYSSHQPYSSLAPTTTAPAHLSGATVIRLELPLPEEVELQQQSHSYPMEEDISDYYWINAEGVREELDKDGVEIVPPPLPPKPASSITTPTTSKKHPEMRHSISVYPLLSSRLGRDEEDDDDDKDNIGRMKHNAAKLSKILGEDVRQMSPKAARLMGLDTTTTTTTSTKKVGADSSTTLAFIRSSPDYIYSGFVDQITPYAKSTLWKPSSDKKKRVFLCLTADRLFIFHSDKDDDEEYQMSASISGYSVSASTSRKFGGTVVVELIHDGHGNSPAFKFSMMEADAKVWMCKFEKAVETCVKQPHNFDDYLPKVRGSPLDSLFNMLDF